MNEIAIIGWSKNPWNFEASCFLDLNQFIDSIEKETHQRSDSGRRDYFLAILLCHRPIGELIVQLEKLDWDKRQLILVMREPLQALDLVHLTQSLPVVAVVNDQEQSRVEDLFNAIVLTRRIEEQAQTHRRLLHEEESRQEKQYEKLLAELKDQQRQINDIQQRLINSLQREKLLHDTLIIIMTSQGIGEIELRLEETLLPVLGPVHLRILLHEGATHPQTWTAPAISFELHEQDKALGRLVITPIETQNFERRELKILENISEAVALHIPRFLAFEANANLETEWRTTFDSISDPLLLVNEDYKVVDANKAARSRMTKHPASSQAPCYQLLFERSQPCEFCRFGQKSNLEAQPQKPGEQWEMSSHELRSKKSKQKIFVHLYRNKYEQLELEKKITAFAQEAEVGIFKASLAHELNNPIGGLLTLAQLQKMDLVEGHPLFPLIAEIEKQAFLCRDLIQDLLQKARNVPVSTRD